MLQIIRINGKSFWQNINATKTVVAAFGILCGLTGMIAGYFEMLQGYVKPDSFLISTIGSSYDMWKTYSIFDLLETYSAMTIIPNFFLTGIIALIVSFLVIVWSVGYIHKKHGIIIFLFLSMIQLLVGGSVVIDLAIITGIVATRINQPISWWRSHLSTKIHHSLALLWPWSLLFFTILSIIMLVMTVLGRNQENLENLLKILAAIMFLPLLFMIAGGFSHDVLKQKILMKNTKWIGFDLVKFLKLKPIFDTLKYLLIFSHTVQNISNRRTG